MRPGPEGQTHTRIHDNTLTQRRNGKAYPRTITCCLVSSKLKPCLDCVPLMPHQNEESAFPEVFDDLCKHLGRWFQLITYDAGACSEANAALVDRAIRVRRWEGSGEASRSGHGG